MKEITKKIFEAGLLDKTFAAMFTRWGLLKPEEYAQLQHKQVVYDTLTTFLENLEELIEQEPPDLPADKPLRETRLEIRITKPPTAYQGSKNGVFTAVEDELGRLITQPDLTFHPGDRIWEYDDGPSLMIENIETIYEGERPFALQITVQR